jgi:light-regulated signal transduction histidine kinase (bacteriophytochrome)
MMFSERLCEKDGAAAENGGTDYPARIREAAGRMQRLIGDLLAYARITEASGVAAAVDLNRVVREVVSDLEAGIESASAAVACGPLPVVAADYTHMRQLFQNLIGNAVKFRRPGVPPRVKVYAADEMRDGRVTVTVEDDGIGIDPRHHDRIFGVFQRLHGKNEYEGNGIGLAVCKKIAERHGGTIRVESRPGEGAKFIITLPVA